MGEIVSLCLVRSKDRRDKHQGGSIETLWGLGKDPTEYTTGEVTEEVTGEITRATCRNRGQRSSMEPKFIVHVAIIAKPLLKFYQQIENPT